MTAAPSWLASRIRESGGVISFEQFMDWVLHDPVHGYYARKITAVGGRGDFSTIPTISPALARAVAAWATESLRATGTKHLIEIGPGEGRLMQAVRQSLPLWLRWRTTFHLVETSDPLRKKQQERLRGGRFQWHRTVEEALAACDGNACLFSNELLDAFPVRRFEQTSQGWQEVKLSLDEAGQWKELLSLDTSLPDSQLFSASFRDGQRIEVHESVKLWLQQWLPHWKRGRMLTIDYGGWDTSYLRRRPHGTLRAYLLQHRLEGAEIYLNVGRQDLTADVHFGDFQYWLSQACSTRFAGSQRDFLLPHLTGNAADQFAADPDGAGTSFQVLDVERLPS